MFKEKKWQISSNLIQETLFNSKIILKSSLKCFNMEEYYNLPESKNLQTSYINLAI